jgi:pyridoxal phosphate enzyme (YggS family)
MKNKYLRILSDLDPAITCVAAVKYYDIDFIKSLYEDGCRHFGENRVQNLLEKKNELPTDVKWHFIGTLQSKKVKTVINQIDVLHSLDRLSLAKEINKFRIKPLDAYIQVNVSNEPSKHGVHPNELQQFLEDIYSLNNSKINLVGLMCIASNTSDKEILKNEFSKMKELLNDLNRVFHLNLKYLSMGMSQDYKLAIKYGATTIRLGSILKA